MTRTPTITVTPHLVADLHVEGERMPVHVHLIDHPDARVLVDTHLHGDHCGGSHLFADNPIYFQRRELEDAGTGDDYIREWVDAPGVRYVPVDGEFELLPGLRLLPAPGHARGTQVVVIETGGQPVVIGGDVAVWVGALDEPWRPNPGGA